MRKLLAQKRNFSNHLKKYLVGPNCPRSNLNGGSKSDKQCPLEGHQGVYFSKGKRLPQGACSSPEKLENEHTCAETLHGLSAGFRGLHCTQDLRILYSSFLKHQFYLVNRKAESQ